MNNNNKNIKTIDFEIFASFAFIITILVSILLNYNRKEQVTKNRFIFNNEEARIINITNRIVIFTIISLFLYINYTNYKESVKKGIDDTTFKNQLLISLFGWIAAIIAIVSILEINPNNTRRNRRY